MHIYQVGNIDDKREFLRALNVHSRGVSIMADKMEIMLFLIRDLKTPAVNILKQDALSIGADLAVPSGVITYDDEVYDSLLIGTRKHIEILSRKELAQPFGLREVAKELKASLNGGLRYPTEIMGVINANSDSFFKGSRFNRDSALEKIEEMVSDGANIIDIGGVSSRPNSDPVSVDEELRRVAPICDAIRERKLYRDVSFSIDSYEPKVIEYALNSGFNLINDITGATNDRVIELAVEYEARLAIMHKKGTPKDMQVNPTYRDVTAEVSAFFDDRVEKVKSFGLKERDIVLDVGIGFGKSLEHNLTLIENLPHFRRFNVPILIGASRKSMIDNIIPTPVEERLAGTLAIHLKAISGGANIVRCHDVKEHKQAIEVWETMSSFCPI